MVNYDAPDPCFGTIGQKLDQMDRLDVEAPDGTESTTLALSGFATDGGRRTVMAEPSWRNPGGGLWGGFAAGVCVRVVEIEPGAVGEPLAVTLSYASALYPGELDVRTRCLRQGRSVGVWEVEIRQAPAGDVGVHAIVTMAQRPSTQPFQFLHMPAVPPPEAWPIQVKGGDHRVDTSFEFRSPEPHLPTINESARSVAWVRPRRGRWDKAVLAMLTDNSAPRAMYALGPDVGNATLSLTAYLHASTAELLALGDDFVLVDYDRRVGGGGASDEHSRYWSRSGVLLATSEQLVWYHERPPSNADHTADRQGHRVAFNHHNERTDE